MDTRNLLKKGNRWYLNFTFPGSFGIEKLRGKKIRISLGTPEYSLAKNIRDSYISNLISANTRLQVVDRILKHLVEADEDLRKLVEEKIPALKIKSLSSAGKPSALSVGDLVGKFLSHLEQNSDLKISSQRRYRSALACFAFVLGPGTPVSSLEHKEIQGFVSSALRLPLGYSYASGTSDLPGLIEKAEKSKGKRLSVSNVKFILTTAGSMFKWALNNEIIDKNPVKALSVYFGAVKQKHKLKPDHNQADLLCALPCPEEISPFEWKYAPLVARYTGMRVGEISQLTAEGICMKHGILCINVSGDLKTESSQRVIPVPDKLKPHLQAVLKARPSGRLFDLHDFEKDGLVKFGHGFLKLYNRRAKKIGDFSFHCWRVYANSEMLDGGAAQTDCERILGHKSSTTNSAYVADDVKRMERAVNLIF